MYSDRKFWTGNQNDPKDVMFDRIRDSKALDNTIVFLKYHFSLLSIDLTLFEVSHM